jgi:hypothetical protein
MAIEHLQVSSHSKQTTDKFLHIPKFLLWIERKEKFKKLCGNPTVT